MADKSLQSLVISRIIWATVLFALIISLVVYVQLSQTLLILRNRNIVDEARDIASYIETTEENTPYLDLPEDERQFYAEAKELHQYVVRNVSGEIIFTSPVAYTNLFPANKSENEKESFFDFTGKNGTEFLGSTVVDQHKDKLYIVQVAQSEESAKAFPSLLLEDFLHRILIFGPPFLLMLIAVIYWTIRQSLKPVRIASEKANAISFKRMDVRLPETGMPLEIKPLLQAMNNALSRLEHSIETQREFVANAAHELRTPLSILRSHVDSFEDGETVRRLRQDIDSMSRLTTQLLDMSRLD
ncbi:MAG: histidine kinase dimerization/phospho-acceptor domain-containing protein, partial [Alphaproteobacteria bacterium]